MSWSKKIAIIGMTKIENSGIFNDFIMLMIASSVKTVVNFLKIIIKLLIMVVSKLNN